MRNARFGLYLALVVLVFLLQSKVARLPGTGAIASEDELRVELNATQEAPGAWPMGEGVPYRYRWVFRAVVLSIERLSPAVQTKEGFYRLFIACSALSLFLACAVFDVLLRRLGFSTKQAMAGVGLYLLGFPIFFAYDYPIHTREDLLENACFCLALLAVIADRPIATVLATLLAANVREMGLLAAVPFWFCSKRPAPVRASVIGAATLGTLLVTSIRELSPRLPWFLDRSAWHPEGYKTTLGAPLEGALYVFVCFGALWFAAIAGALTRRARARGPEDLLAPWPASLCVFLALASSIALGQVREVRTVYLAFPWVIGLALEYFSSDFLSDMKLVRARVAGGVALAVGMVFLAKVASSHDFVESLRKWIGDSFQPGFEAPAKAIVDEKGELVAEVFPYTASPWNGVFLVFHTALSAAIISARLGEWLRARASNDR